MSNKRAKAIEAFGERMGNTLEKKSTRRGFLKGTIVAGLAIAGGVTVAKKVKKAVLKENNSSRYLADELGVERTWKGKKLYLMSKDEKNEMVAELLKSSKTGGV